MGVTRVTNFVLLTMLNKQISDNKRRELELQEKLATGKNINRAQDDPIGASRMLQMEATLSSLDQYLKNVQRARAFVGTTETTLNGVLGVLEGVRSVAAIQGEPAVSASVRRDLIPLRHRRLKDRPCMRDMHVPRVKPAHYRVGREPE